MEVRELRVGNKVNLNGADVTVKTIEYNPVSEEYFIRVLESIHQVKVSYLSPIPITGELLLKAGFENYRLKIGQINIKFNGANFSVNDIAIEIYYIHQLQNLIYSLTGSELTFKQ